MISPKIESREWSRRHVLRGAVALTTLLWLPARAADSALPAIPALWKMMGERSLVLERVRLELPRLADNGLAVPVRIIVEGPFMPAAPVRSIHLFSENNPVPEMAKFEYLAPVDRVEIESRVRLASSQQVVAVAALADGTLLGAVAEVVVTLAGCMDGT